MATLPFAGVLPDGLNIASTASCVAASSISPVAVRLSTDGSFLRVGVRRADSTSGFRADDLHVYHLLGVREVAPRALPRLRRAPLEAPGALLPRPGPHAAPQLRRRQVSPSAAASFSLAFSPGRRSCGADTLAPAASPRGLRELGVPALLRAEDVGALLGALVPGRAVALGGDAQRPGQLAQSYHR